MVTGIIGRKVGMTQIFDADGTVHPATVIKAGPCVVVQAKTKQTDGYEAVQLGFVEERAPKANKPTAGHFKKANVPATRVRREVTVAAGAETPKVGEQVLASIFADGERVDVIGTGRGKGFQGVVKGMRAAGRMGGGRVTIHNLKVLRVDTDNHLLIVEGGIPGAPTSYVIIRKAVTAKKLKVAQVEKPKKGKK